MDILVDTSVSFVLSGGRKVTVDALELEEFVGQLFEVKGVKKPILDEISGQPKTGADGKVQERRELDWEVVVPELKAWIKKQTGIDIKKSEAIGIWKNAFGVWAKKNAIWDAPEQDSPGSPSSPPSTDHRYAD